MKVEKKSILTGAINVMELDITKEQLIEYEQGVKLVQVVFPNLSIDEREFLISGTTPSEWKTMENHENI